MIGQLRKGSGEEKSFWKLLFQIPREGRCREVQGCTGRCKEVQGGAGSCREVQGGVGRCREVQGGVGRCREVQEV